MIVMKFGGTSMGDADCIRNKVANIVLGAVENGKQPVVVVSAIGGITNLLLSATEAAIQRQPEKARTIVDDILHRHLDVLGKAVKQTKFALDASEYITKTLKDLQVFLDAIGVVGELTPRSYDIVLAVGEKLSARILTSVLEDRDCPAEFTSLDRLIHGNMPTDSEDYWPKVQDFFRASLENVREGAVPVLTGFFGPTTKGILNCVGRGYSDFCASLAGTVKNAEEIQIWTDVDGVATANPTKVPNAKILERISFDEMAELAHFGAKVLHPHSVWPALKENIPIRILNTFHPEAQGTLIVDETVEADQPFKSIAYKKDVTIIRISSYGMLMAAGFMAKITECFARHGISIDLVSTSEVSVSLSVDQSPKEIEPLVNDLKKLGRVVVTPDQAIMCLVGAEIQHNASIYEKVFEGLRQEGIGVNMISMGDLRINLSIVIDNEHRDKTVQLLHRTFFGV